MTNRCPVCRHEYETQVVVCPICGSALASDGRAEVDGPMEEPKAEERGGIAALRAGQVEQAIEILCEALAKNPGDAAALKHLGIAHIEQGEWANALAVLKKAVALAPDDAQARDYLGLVHAHFGRSDEAREQYEEALRMRHDHAASEEKPGSLPDRVCANTSGQGRGIFVPADVKGWNWGAFVFTLPWGIANRVWVAAAWLLPGLGLLVAFWLGVCGNEEAWRARRWDSVEQFRATQHAWSRTAGIIVFSLVIGCCLLGTIVLILDR